MSVGTEKIRVVFRTGDIRVLRVHQCYPDGTVLTKFAGTYMRVRQFMDLYLTDAEPTDIQRDIIFRRL